MRPKYVHEPFVVSLRPAKQAQKPAIVSACHAEPASNELAKIVACDIAIE